MLEPLSVLDNLVRSGIWSRSSGAAMRFKVIAMDADSIINHMNHGDDHKVHSKQKHPNSFDASSFSNKIDKLFSLFLDNKIRIILVHEKKKLDTPASAVYKKSVNRKLKSGADIRVVKAHYSALPVLTRLSRDNKCPVLTNRGTFILMDCRAGFILFSELWANIQSKSRSSSDSHSVQTKSGLSQLRFHYNSMFLRQHPGLNASLAANLFPLCSLEFTEKYADSFRKLRVYETDPKAKSANKSGSKSIARSNSRANYQMAANKLEMAITFLAGKTSDLVGNLIRCEAKRSKSTFDEDFRSLFNYNLVARYSIDNQITSS